MSIEKTHIYVYYIYSAAVERTCNSVSLPNVTGRPGGLVMNLDYY